MEYETAYIGAAPSAPKQETASPAQKRRAVPALPSKEERHRRGARRPPALSPCGAAAYGFLKPRFLPHYAGQQAHYSPKEQQQFCRCFPLLCAYYDIHPVDTSALSYPYKREVLLHEADRLLKDKFHFNVSIDWEEENGNFTLNAIERFDMNSTLFFIPVLPLHKMMQHRKRKKAARMLLCIFSYLYRKAGVPCYWDEGTYLYWQYDMLCQWVTHDPEGWEDDFDSFNSQVNTALHIGEVMLRRLYSSVHLENFDKWISEFKPHDAYDTECYCLAKRFYELWQDFPNTDIYSHADGGSLPDPEEYDDTECIAMEKYISFVCSTEGWLYNQLEQAVNSDFNECSSMQEPVIRRVFDPKTKQAESFDYECRLFPLINELCYLINIYNYEN